MERRQFYVSACNSRHAIPPKKVKLTMRKILYEMYDRRGTYLALLWREDSFFSQSLVGNVTSKQCTATTFREYFASFKLCDVGRCVLLKREKNIVCDYFEKENSKYNCICFKLKENFCAH